LLAKTNGFFGTNLFALAAIRTPSPEELESPHVLFEIRYDDYACWTNIGTPTASEAQIGIHGHLAAEPRLGLLRRKWISKGDTPGFQANQRFSQLAEEHRNLPLPSDHCKRQGRQR
jgi:hypothetical protein